MTSTTHDLSGRRVLVPGGTGAIGEGVVRAYLAAGAHVVVPTRTDERAEDFTALVAGAGSDRLHVLVADYASFDAAQALARRVRREIGAVDDVVAPIGGWWAGGALSGIDQADWQGAFVDLATTHMAVVRAFLPALPSRGAYTIVVGTSALSPVPGSGLVSMEQAALLMMQRVLADENQGTRRVFALVLGQMSTRLVQADGPDVVAADQVGQVAVAASGSTLAGRQIQLSTQAEVAQALSLLTAETTSSAGVGAP